MNSSALLHSARNALMGHPVRRVALLMLCFPYFLSGIHKIIDFDAGIAEMTSYVLLPAAPYAAATILIQVGCPLLIITGFCRWIGALVLALFTIAAACIANPFWAVQKADYIPTLQAFSEHLAIAGGFLLISWYALHKYKNKGEDDWR